MGKLDRNIDVFGGEKQVVLSVHQVFVSVFQGHIGSYGVLLERTGGHFNFLADVNTKALGADRDDDAAGLLMDGICDEETGSGFLDGMGAGVEFDGLCLQPADYHAVFAGSEVVWFEHSGSGYMGFVL